MILADHASDFAKRRLAKSSAQQSASSPISEQLDDYLVTGALYTLLRDDDIARTPLPELARLPGET